MTVGKKYREYTANELQDLVGKRVLYKRNNSTVLILGCDEHGKCWHAFYGQMLVCDTGNLLSYYVQMDGLPCGVEI